MHSREGMRDAFRFMVAGADPGFLVRGSADSIERPPTDDFVKCSEKLHGIETIMACRGLGGGTS